MLNTNEPCLPCDYLILRGQRLWCQRARLQALSCLQERKKLSRLHTEFSQVDPADVRGRYGHKVYGFLLPPKSGQTQHFVMLIKYMCSDFNDPHNLHTTTFLFLH